MIGWEDEGTRRSFIRNVMLAILLLVAAAGFFAGWYAGTHRCPEEDSCTYSNHQWVPTEH